MRSRICLLFSSVLLLPLVCPAQQNGSLKVKTSTTRAGVFVDGKYVGPAGDFGIFRTYAVPAGDHEVKLVEPRYEEAIAKVTIQAGKKTVLRQPLKALPAPQGPFGRLRTQSPEKFAAVYVNDKYMGHADEFDAVGEGLLLVPGEYAVKIVPSAAAPVEQKVKLEAGKTVLVK